MPNTKSAEKRVRSSARKQLHNRSISSRLRRVEKGFRDTVIAGKKAEASKSLSDTLSTIDKAVKSGVITRATANRKKSRLTIALNRAK
jgi:small subunit ribosomal protein S20